MPDNQDSIDAARLLRLATYASVATASVLILAKLVAWYLTSSISVLASLVDSLMDVGASLINLLAVRYALMPPDLEHRFGHGKAESLAGLGQAMFIAGSAVFLVLEAIDRLIHPRPLEQIGVGIGVMGFAIVATLILLAIQRYVIRRTHSTAIRADALHYATDLLTGAGIIVALVLALIFGWNGLDAWFAIAVTGFIFYGAWRIATDALRELLDRELPDDQREQIEQLARSYPGVLGIHDLRTRQSGRACFIQLHLELDGSRTLTDAHGIADEVEARIQAQFPTADIIIHQDPATPRA